MEGHRQKIESRFFELLKVHRENCNEIQLGGKTGKYAIQEMIREVRLCADLALELNKQLEKPYVEERILNFAYLAFYFGSVSYERSKTLKTFKQFVEGYDQEFVNEFISLCAEKKEQYKAEHNFAHNIFGGHQIRLSQYFRHLFQTVTYINGQPPKILCYEEKYEYIKTLRAQLSPHEQVLLFYASMSVLGEGWEGAHLNNPNKQLITKYNLVKNIFSFHPRYSKYHPCVKFENRPMPDCRKALLKLYQ